MDLGLWSTSKLAPAPATTVTCHMEEVTWAFHIGERGAAEALHSEIEEVLRLVREEHKGGGSQQSEKLRMPLL